MTRLSTHRASAPSITSLVHNLRCGLISWVTPSPPSSASMMLYRPS
uniref:Uncharacterized protein n=1 Tax=Triticum urartu TaxID=4572 RepID=A0A8R7U9E2_TRIUA